MVGVNCIFNEIIPTYEEDYFNEIKKLKFQTAEETNTVEAFKHLVGMKYQDEDNLLEYQNTRVAEFKGYIVVYRAPVLGEDQRGHEEKSPIHVADVVRMMGGYRVGNRGPRTPGVGEVFPNQEVQLDNVDNGEAPRLSGVGGAVPHIVSTGDVPRLRPVLGRAVSQQKRRSVSAQIRSVSERRPCGLVDSDRSDTKAVASDRVQRRVQFKAVGGSKASDQANCDSDANLGSKAPRSESNALRGVGRRAVSSEQHELADLEVQSVKSDGPSLVARREYGPLRNYRLRESG